jgi:hypothetical protein
MDYVYDVILLFSQIDSLALVRGNDLKDLCFRLLARLFGSEISVTINFTGSNGKYNFKGSNFNQIIKGE